MPNNRLNRLTEKIEAAIENTLGAMTPPGGGELARATRYALCSGGKRIRPVLALSFAGLCGMDEDAAMPFAVGIECIHTYSLIHDDLPCMDDDDYRRGKKTLHRVFGEGLALLAGDALLNSAFELMLETPAEPAALIKALAYASRESGRFGMAGGQAVDITNKDNKRFSEGELTDIYDKKTAALLRAACVGGCLLAGGDDRTAAAAEDYATHLGLAFQIRDDLLDRTAVIEATGRAKQSDSRLGKTGLADIIGEAAAEESARRHTDAASAALLRLPAGRDREFLEFLAFLLLNREK